ncbi:MAG: ferrochelatase [Halieaceae bacterium]|jgi:ferrochelatase
MSYQGQTDFQHGQEKAPPRGVILTNLGTPDAPDTASVRRYLAEFLADPRVVEIPRLLWWCILHFFILPLRPKRSAALYQQVWTPEGSPLLAITLHQAEKLQQVLDLTHGPGSYLVCTGMRYGNPSISSAVQALTAANARNITVLPLYPQYSAVTTGSTFDALATELRQYRWVPQLKFISGYHQHDLYVQAIVDSISQHIEQHGVPDRLLLSYHGTPLSYLHKGDPYFCFCSQTSRLVGDQLNLPDNTLVTTFQSRFGKAKWLQPYTSVVLKELAHEGIKHVAVICPGFSVDCLETLEEIDVENRDYFLEAGGQTFHYIPCLNAADSHVRLMADLVQAPGKIPLEKIDQ